jgi:hypothetical protein
MFARDDVVSKHPSPSGDLPIRSFSFHFLSLPIHFRCPGLITSTQPETRQNYSVDSGSRQPSKCTTHAICQCLLDPIRREQDVRSVLTYVQYTDNQTSTPQSNSANSTSTQTKSIDLTSTLQQLSIPQSGVGKTTSTPSSSARQSWHS